MRPRPRPHVRSASSCRPNNGHENGHKRFGIDEGAKYAKAFNVSFEWRMIGAGPQWPRNPYLVHLAQQLSPESWQKILPTIELIMIAALRNQFAAAEKAVERGPGERKKTGAGL